MTEDREDEPFVDLYISNWEQQCINQLEAEQDLEGQLTTEKELVNHNIWCSFQNTATAIAQLYKDRVQDAASLWLPFQTAAGTVTTLYKECGDGIKRVSELGIHCGYQRRNKEILQWVRKKRRHIRREELIAYLCGKPPPPRPQNHRGSPRPRLSFSDRHGSPINHQSTSSIHPSILHCSAENPSVADDNLRIFGEALAINTNVTRRQRNSELNTFFANEYARHCIKRPASSSPPHDVNMDSPTHKRSRHF
ncbi:hypothetical protein RUM43_004602 [Polyplax serrata]|uniref:Uncharacterized protein n=1 Tax=Polyplax serrata TaxID=468196 RepID=A0AAN8SCA8_POLSC